MSGLSKLSAKRCHTAAGVLVKEGKVLLVKHKKLGIWLAPGGHLDENELPNQAAEREFWEETGVRVKVVSSYELIKATETEYLPMPLAVNLHWISQENYRRRLEGKKGAIIGNGKYCEQHITYVYLVKPVGKVNFRQNVEETTGIGWFSQAEIESLETTEDIRAELRWALVKVNKKF